MLILFTELSILQADGTVLVPRCVKLLLGNGEGVVRLANLILETRVLVDGYIRSAFSNTGVCLNLRLENTRSVIEHTFGQDFPLASLRATFLWHHVTQVVKQIFHLRAPLTLCQLVAHTELRSATVWLGAA
jgi:hypothetical protein